MVKIIVAYGDDAYDIKEIHEGETHTAKEWYEIYSEPWSRGGYNPTEILEFATMEEAEEATLDPGSFIPKCYQVEGISDNL